MSKDLTLSISENEISRVIKKAKEIVRTGTFTEDWTYSITNQKNVDFCEKYLCGEDEFRKVVLGLDKSSFYEAERNNSPKARRDDDAAKEIVYKFIPEETFYLREIDTEAKKINLYVKFTFPGGIEDSVIIISFHESERSLEEQKKYDTNKAAGQV